MNPQPNVIIIHGCPDTEEKAVNPETRTYDKHWMPWIAEQLESRGIHTARPLMPRRVSRIIGSNFKIK